MWRWAILVVALLDNISSQPISESTENDQAPQYDFVKCCPCPGSEFWEKLAAGQSRGDIQDGFSNLARSSSDGINGCQCRDADGSPSLLSGRTMIPVWTDMSPQDKEDGKTILHPEMDMASGVLETLREATDEEYREALARDAARSAVDARDVARSTDDEDKPLVTIVVSHDDDAMPEASGTQEARVAPPVDLKDSKEIGTVPLLLQPLHKILGKSTADVNERVKGLTKGLDGIMLGTASDIHERVSEINKGIEGLKLKEKPVLSLLPGKGKSNSLGNEHLKNILKINDLGSILLKNAKENADSVIRLGPAKISGLKTPLLRRITPLSKQPRDKENNADNSPAPSNVNEQAIERNAEAPFDLKSLLLRKDTGLKGIKPLKLDDLLNLKDVELIPSKPLKLNLPALNLFPTSRSQKTERKDSKKCEKVTPVSTDIHKTPETEILDVVPSASEIKGVTATSKPATNIINNVLTADAKHESTEESGTESTETTKQIIQDPKSQKVQRYLDHGVEITISSDGNTEIENVSVEREFTPTKNESNEEVEDENAVPDEDDEENIDKDHQQSLAEEGEIDVDQTVNSPLAVAESDNVIDDENSTVQEARDFGEEDVEFSETEENQDIIEESSNSNGAFQFVSEESENGGSDTFDNFEFRTEKPSAEDTETVEEESTQTKSSDDILESNESEEMQQKSSPNLHTNIDTNPKSVESFEVNSRTLNEKSAELKENELSQNSQSDSILPTIKERISIKLKTLQKPQAKVFTVARSNAESEKKTEFSGEAKISDDFQSSESPDSFPSDNAAEKSSEIIEKSSEIGQVIDTTAPKNSNTDTQDDMSSSATFFKPRFVKVRNPETIGKSDIFSDEISEPTFAKSRTPEIFKKPENFSDEISKEISDEQNERSLSSCGFNAKDKSAEDSNTGASLRQDVIVQPSSPLPFSGGSLFDLPILPALPALPELPPLPPLNLNARIPTLEDLNSRIANLLPLGGLAKEASNEEGSEECSNADPTVDASSKSSTSLLPPLSLRPLQDINLDIFRLNPLGSSGPEIPSLNLNTFKTKLALPEHLGLKPLELQHSFGNKKTGLLGAKLRFGPTTIGVRDRGLDILGNPLGLGGLPNLESMRDSMKVSASSLLKSPILPPPTTLLGDGLPTIDKIADDLKFHAENLRAHHENTAKNVQDTLASTLSEVKLKSLGTRKSKYAHPQPESLVEKMAIAHDDLNDKLRGIHVDLQDRLTTLHDDILENAKLPMLKLPTIQSTIRPLARALGIEKSTPSKSRTSSSSRKDSTRKPGFKINKPSQTKGKSALSSSNLFNQDKTTRPFKLSQAASSLQPKTIEVPKLITTSSKPPFTLANAHNLKESSIFSSRKPTQKDPLIKPFKPLGEVKITIGTTPRPTTKMTNLKPSSRASKLSTAKPSTKPVLRDREATTPRTTRPTLAQRLQASRDSKGFASEVQPIRVLPPSPSQSSQSQLKKSQQTSPSPKSSVITENPNKNLKAVKKTPVSSLRQPQMQIAPKELVKKGLNFKPALKSAASAKTTESPVLSKLREAIKARIASKSKAPETLVTPVRNSADQDMLRSASENHEIKVVEKNAMKENVTYKCKMICVKDP